MISADHAHFLSIWLEASLYGIFTVLFFACFYVLYTRPVNGQVPVVMLVTMSLMWALNTAHVAGTLRHVEDAFFRSNALPAQYLANRAAPLNLLNKSIYGAVLMIGDGLLIYRCWIIWQRSWWIVSAPSFFLAATTAVGWIVVWEYSQITQGSNIFQGQIKILVPVTFVLSLVTNLLTTALVIYRIRIVSAAVQRSMPKDRSQSEPYRHTLSVIIESGAIYPAILVLTLVLYGAKRNEQALLTGAMCQIIGIVPTLTILQVRLGYSSYDKAYANRNTPSNNQNFNLGSMSYPPTPGTATFGQIGPARKSGTTSRAMSRSSSDQHTYYRNTVDLDSLDVSSDLGTPTKFPSKTYATLNAQDEKWTRAPSPSLGLPIHIEVSNHRQLNAMKNSTRPMSIHLQRSTESHWDEETLRDSGKTRDDDDMVIEFRRMSEDSPKATSNPYPQPWTVTRTWSR